MHKPGAGVMDWQGIETAPRDGTSVIVYGHLEGFGEYIEVTKYYRDKWLITWMHGHNEPTHWMSLPEPPEPNQ